jgi:adenylosuccinate lyase
MEPKSADAVSKPAFHSGYRLDGGRKLSQKLFETGSTSFPELVGMTFRYELIERYASPEMVAVWSVENRYRTWRKVWVALAEAEAELGLPITEEQLRELREHIDDLNLEVAHEYERRFRHDVVAHIRAYGDQCPKARGIIHLGATSAFVTDNADLVLLRDALQLIRDRLVGLVDALARLAQRYRDVPCLAWTHLQPAQPTTVGKRACLWCYDFYLDFQEVERRLQELRCRGAKGATGTQASFLALFNGDRRKVRQLDELVARKLGFSSSYPVTGQTYSRKVDAQLLDALAGIGISAHKMGTDLRLLASRREIEEPFGEEQVGSSAMPYKRNPMRSERLCSLARLLVELRGSLAHTAATQWLERSLDDSSLRRLALPEAFLLADAILRLALATVPRLVVNEAVIRANLNEELPFMASEAILMAAVKAGGDRQELHERLRVHAMAAAEQMKRYGQRNDFLERLRNDPAFASVPWAEVLRPERYVGRAPEQVDEFIDEWIEPLRRRYPQLLGQELEVEV